jgi:dTDP-4-amino-4,6-dideoxygalactose transaminase
MGEKILKLSKSSISNKEIISVNRVLKKGFFGMGEEVAKFEKKLSIYFNRKVACVTNGFSALQLALQAVGIKRGDEVLVPSLTYIATYQAISAIGAKPISCDVNLEDLIIDINFAKKKISKKTKAIILVFFGGHANKIEELYNFAKKNNLRVIEDAAHAFGSYYKNQKIGSFGDISCFSFDGIKNITSGEGGCVVTNDSSIINKIKVMRVLGIEKSIVNKTRNWRYNSKVQGWRYHMSDIMAAIGIVQLERLNELKKKRQSLAKNYDVLFKNNKFIYIFSRNYLEVNPHIYLIILKKKIIIQKLRNFLLKKGIETGLHYQPNHLLTKYKTNYKLPVTDFLSKCILSIPLHPGLKKNNQIYIRNAINYFFLKK